MFGFFRKLFPINANSLDEFVTLAKQHQCMFITGYGGLHFGTGFMNSEQIDHQPIRYEMSLAGETSTGRQINYKVVCEARSSLGDYKIGYVSVPCNVESYSHALIRSLLTATSLMVQVKRQLPYIGGILTSSSMEFNEERMQRLYREAVKNEIEAISLAF